MTELDRARSRSPKASSPWNIHRRCLLRELSPTDVHPCDFENVVGSLVLDNRSSLLEAIWSPTSSRVQAPRKFCCGCVDLPTLAAAFRSRSDLRLIPVCRPHTTSAYTSPVAADIVHHRARGRFERQQGAWRAEVAAGQLPTVIRRRE